MSRKPTVWFRKQTGYYYTTLNGKKVRLAKSKKDAEKAFHALMARTDPVLESPVRISFRKPADLYLDPAEQRLKSVAPALRISHAGAGPPAHSHLGCSRTGTVRNRYAPRHGGRITE
jgi:hypothetical protein